MPNKEYNGIFIPNNDKPSEITCSIKEISKLLGCDYPDHHHLEHLRNICMFYNSESEEDTNITLNTYATMLTNNTLYIYGNVVLVSDNEVIRLSDLGLFENQIKALSY